MPQMNPDLMRALLFKVESLQDGSTHQFYASALVEEGGRFEGADPMEIRINMMYLFDKKFVVGRQLAMTSFEVERLTAEGAEFLQSVRDDRIWSKTKDGAKQAGGFTIDVLVALAKGLVKQEAQKWLGIDAEF